MLRDEKIASAIIQMLKREIITTNGIGNLPFLFFFVSAITLLPLLYTSKTFSNLY